jgi:hypothetical protein
VSPFSPSSLNIIPSIRSEFDRVPISCKPLFGSATKVTKVCNTLPTYELHISALEVGISWSISDHGEDYTPWATLRPPLGNLKPSFWKLAKKIQERNLKRKQENSSGNCSVSQLLKMRDEMRISPTIRTKVRANILKVHAGYIRVRVICYAQGTYRGWTLVQLLICWA